MRSITDPTKKQTPQERKKAELLASGKFVEGERGELIRVQEDSIPVGLPSDERIRDLEMLNRPMTEMEAREYALRGFDPSATPNQLFSLAAGLGFDPVGQLANKVLGSLASKVFGKSASEAAKIQAARKEMVEGFSERMAQKKAIDLNKDLMPESMKNMKLQNQAQRAIRSNMIDDRFLRDRADHILRVAEREYAQGNIDAVNAANKIIDDMTYYGKVDDFEYDKLMLEIENFFRQYPNTVGTVGDLAGDSKVPILSSLAKSQKGLYNGKIVPLNNYGGRLAI